ncbi:CoA transferase [Arthrobacter sp. 35W]|uniref:CoA transferase n=1 Tax=Arthrobacter sp. 35W TaxID=1132441 RepID=UPI0003F85BAE|nr:CoA transferase [Arthrobacter sp. 35W]
MSLLTSSGSFLVPGGVAATGTGTLASAFDTTGLAVASIAAAGLAVAALVEQQGGGRPAVTVDRSLASLWFAMSFEPTGWELPPVWDAVAGDYRCADGWIRLHTNAPHHRAAAMRVLGLPEGPDSGLDRGTVGDAVAAWAGEDLEAEVVAAGGCAALMRTHAAWLRHPQGAAVAAEPLIAWGTPRTAGPRKRSNAVSSSTHARPGYSRPGSSRADSSRPLAGVRVLDLTRVIAGPVASRFLASLGAEVLRIDPPWWQEPAVEAEMTVGKRCARLDLRTADGLAALHRLLDGADILLHGYRGGAMERLGLGEAALAARHPGLVDVGLNAYGWTGPWRTRRGFDSLVQMSCGIADAGMAYFNAAAPRPLPVQALDHATGYLAAAAAITSWTRRLQGSARSARLSLARTAVELAATAGSGPATPPDPGAHQRVPEDTAWGPGSRLPQALAIDGVELRWDVPAAAYGSAPPRWQEP